MDALFDYVKQPAILIAIVGCLLWLFKVAVDIGAIRSSVEQIPKMVTKINDHEVRISVLERG